MKRRAAVLSLAAIPLALFAQPRGGQVKIGFLYFASRKSAIDSRRYPQFVKGMADLGYVEGRNLVIEARFADGKPEQLPALVAELERAKVSVIVVGGNPAIHAAHQGSAGIPVVMAQSPDPVAQGLAKSLARPGGKVTGLTSATSEIELKMLEFLNSVVPGLSRVAILSNSSNRTHPPRVVTLRDAAKTIGAAIVPVAARAADELEPAFEAMARERAQALIILGDTYFLSEIRRLANLALKNRLPSAHTIPDYTEAGGLMSYGTDIADNFRRAASYVDKVLKGAKPGDLPIEQPTNFELVINLTTAKTLGLTIPPGLMLQAHRVIE
jgi:putative ABC transport system substrate-binding protein